MNGFRIHTLILALALGGWVASAANADPIVQPTISYDTSGTVGGSDGGPIDFTGASGSFTTPGTLSLGSFDTPVLPTSASLSYTNTPFTIDVSFTSGGSTSDLIINGVLNGTLTGNTSSTVIASVTSVQADSTGGPLPFPLNTFTVLAPQVLAPRGVLGGVTYLYAYSSFNPAGEIITAPEPTSIALFGIVLVGLGLRRRLRAAR